LVQTGGAYGSRMEETWPWPMEEAPKFQFVPSEAKAVWGHEAQQRLLGKSPRRYKETFTFAVNGDAEAGYFPFNAFPPGKHAFVRQFRDMQTRGIDFVLQLGDFVTRGTPKNYARFINLLEENATKPFFPAIGNHDRAGFNPRKDADKTLFRETFSAETTLRRGPGDFFFDHGGYRFIILDNADSVLTADQLRWLEFALDTGRRKIVALHIPPVFLKHRLHRPDDLLPPVNGADEIRTDYARGYFSRGALPFGLLMGKYHVDRVYMGHMHKLAYGQFLGVKYVLSGSGGSPMYWFTKTKGLMRTHYLLVEAGPDGIKERIILLKGKKTMTFASPKP